MTTAYTESDGLGFFLTSAEAGDEAYTPDASLGGMRSAVEVRGLGFEIDNPIPNVAIDFIGYGNTAGTGYIRAASTSTLAYTAPGDTEGTAATVANGATVLLESNDTDKAIRVTRTSADNLGGRATLTLLPSRNNVIAQDNISSAERTAGHTSYRALMLHNRTDAAITFISLDTKSLGTQATSDGGQLGAAGAGTITTSSDSFADWPTQGYAVIVHTVSVVREWVYYTSRTSTTLTVPAAGRALFGTTAAAGAAADEIYSRPGLIIGTEAANGTTGKIEELANDTTAPTGASWYGKITKVPATYSSLSAHSNLGIWFWRDIPTCAVGHPAVETIITASFYVGGTLYAKEISGLYAIADSSKDLYEIYLGEDDDPDLDAAADDTSASLPFSTALAAPVAGETEWRITVRKRNEWNLASLNTYYRSITIDSNGDEVTTELTAPTGTTLENYAGGKMLVRSTYYPAQDDDPADTWLVYATTTGVDPNPASDTPTEITMDTYGLSVSRTLNYAIGPYSWGDDVRVLVRVMRSSDDEESENTTALQENVNTQTLWTVPDIQVRASDEYGEAYGPAFDKTDYLNAPTNTVYFHRIPGETQFWAGSTLVWRAVYVGEEDSTEDAVLYIPNGWALVNNTISGASASTGEAVDVVSANEIYLCVDDVRLAKIDVSAMQIEADTFVLWDSLDTIPVNAASYQSGTETFFQLYHPINRAWQPYLSIDEDGVLTMAQRTAQRTA